MIITGHSPLSINTSISSIPEQDVISQWVSEDPGEKERKKIASEIKKAAQTGILALDYYMMKDITSLPPLPEGIFSLELKDAFALHSVPPLPDSLKKLHIHNCQYIDISNLPSGIEALNISIVKTILDVPDGVHYLKITRCNVPVLPKELIKLELKNCHGGSISSDSLTNLKELTLEYCEEVEIYQFPPGLEVIDIIGHSFSLPDLPALPDKLKELTISNPQEEGEEEFIIPTRLPATLSKITLNFHQAKQWHILEKDLPQGINIIYDNVIINKECFKRQDVLFCNMYTDTALMFASGDVLYGLSPQRAKVRKIIEGVNGFNNKNIVVQNTLTNAVWDRINHRKFNSDEQIKNLLNDDERGIQFKGFLEHHKSYNITEKRFAKFTDDERWIKTSKAGLEFQTKIREEKVIFCIDSLVDSVDDIARKHGRFGQTITAHELRWIYRNRNDDKIKENVIFSLRGKIVSHETIFSLKDWEKYQPKSMRTTFGTRVLITPP